MLTQVLTQTKERPTQRKKQIANGGWSNGCELRDLKSCIDQ